jgi:CRP-like cAMP-binding protein
VAKEFVAGPTGNRLLNLVPSDEYAKLQPLLQKVELKTDQTVYKQHGAIESYFFPINCVFSAVTIMEDGHAIEVATIGNEGVVGQPAVGVVMTSPHRIFAQIAGEALRADAVSFNREVSRLPKLREILTKYHQTFVFQITQSVACNGLHVIVERCCRWLLMTHDRVKGDELALTHEFLSFMLGVRRSSITEVLQSLQNQALIRYGKGKITVLNREGLEELTCECYQNIQADYQRMLG